MRLKKYLILSTIFIIVLLIHILFLWFLTTIHFNTNKLTNKIVAKISFQSNPPPQKSLPPDPEIITKIIPEISQEAGGIADEIDKTDNSDLDKKNNNGNLSDDAKNTEPKPLENNDSYNKILTHQSPLTTPNQAMLQKSTKKPGKKTKVKNELPMSLAQLTSGFMGYLHKNKPAIQTLGIKKGTVSGAQLAIENYESKVMSSIMATFKRNMHALPKNLPNEQLVLHLLINRNGTIHTLSVACSTGDREIDKFVIMMVQEASSSFPTFPPSIPGVIYEFPQIAFPKFLTLIHVLQSGQELIWQKTVKS